MSDSYDNNNTNTIRRLVLLRCINFYFKNIFLVVGGLKGWARYCFAYRRISIGFSHGQFVEYMYKTPDNTENVCVDKISFKNSFVFVKRVVTCFAASYFGLSLSLVVSYVSICVFSSAISLSPSLSWSSSSSSLSSSSIVLFRQRTKHGIDYKRRWALFTQTHQATNTISKRN